MQMRCFFFGFLLFVFCAPVTIDGQESEERTYHPPKVAPQKEVTASLSPPSWWTQMAWDTIEIIAHARRIRGAEVRVSPRGPEIIGLDFPANENYCLLQVAIPDDLAPGIYRFLFQRPNGSEIELPFKIHGPKSHQPKPLTPADVMYLIMPDRFANGNPANDILDTMRDSSFDRTDVFQRHGGDLAGLQERLPYLDSLGISAIWLNPVQENDQARTSYHGYAITDHYSIDPRLGSNESYRQWSRHCHQRGIKVIMDYVLNHCGSEHFLVKDLPDTSWIHVFEDYYHCNFRATTTMDPYASEADLERFQKGWFDLHMPDLNQRHPPVARFLIQNAIWWVEYAGLDGFRVDTYPYSYLDFTKQWTDALRREYPELTIFGEAWVNDHGIQSFFSDGRRMHGRGGSAPALADFQLHFAMIAALTEAPGWKEGISRVYLTLAQDFLYEHPEQLVTFLDNHDLNRIWTVLEKDWDLWQMGMTLLMTTRGIPCLYYGTEILLEGEGGAFGEQGRVDFPGGWESDPVDKFHREGRTEQEEKAFRFIQKLIELRQNEAALNTGSLIQFVPDEGLYVFARKHGSQTFLVGCNRGQEPKAFQPERYEEVLEGVRTARDHLSDREIHLDTMTLSKNQTYLLEVSSEK